jgi:hypothetical protein
MAWVNITVAGTVHRENRIAASSVSYTQYEITHYFLPFTITKHISIIAYFMVRNKHKEIVTNTKITSQKKLF